MKNELELCEKVTVFFPGAGAGYGSLKKPEKVGTTITTLPKKPLFFKIANLVLIIFISISNHC
jgi:hypothetical protein